MAFCFQKKRREVTPYSPYMCYINVYMLGSCWVHVGFMLRSTVFMFYHMQSLLEVNPSQVRVYLGSSLPGVTPGVTFMQSYLLLTSWVKVHTWGHVYAKLYFIHILG